MDIRNLSQREICTKYHAGDVMLQIREQAGFKDSRINATAKPATSP